MSKESKDVKEKEYKIEIKDTYIDEKTGILAKDFGCIYKVPQEMSTERAEKLIKAKIAKVVK